MSVGKPAPLATGNSVAEEGQGAFGGHRRVQLPQATGGGIARVGEGLLPVAALALVERPEAREGHEDLSAHLQQPWKVTAAQAQRHGAERAHIGGDVLPPGAVPPRGRAHEPPLLVAKAHGESVDLRLRRVFDPFHTQTLAHTPVEVPHLLLAEGVGEGEHGHLVHDLRKGFQGGGPHPLGRRVGDDEVGKARLQVLELAQEPVVLGVRNLRRIEDVVEVVVVLDEPAQLGGAQAYGGGRFLHYRHKGRAARPPARTPNGRPGRQADLRVGQYPGPNPGGPQRPGPALYGATGPIGAKAGPPKPGPPKPGPPKAGPLKPGPAKPGPPKP